MNVLDKIAVVFHGIVGGMSSRNGVGLPSNINDCAKTIDYSILSNYDYDVFIHSWSVDHKDNIVSLYNPKACLFQKQEHFGYTSKDISSEEIKGQAYRTMSRYTSLRRAVNLKKAYELENNFRYKWIIVLRFDLVFFNKLNLLDKDPSNLYICSEPQWPNIHEKSIMHDIVYLSSSENIDTFSNLSEEMAAGIYSPVGTHAAAYKKATDMFAGNVNKILYGFKRYEDVEVYRTVIHPELIPGGHIHGALETKFRLENLLNILE